jgi:hypothetical protein
MQEMSEELNAWLSPVPVPAAIPEIRELAAGINAAAAPHQVEAEVRTANEEAAKRSHEPIMRGLQRIVTALNEQGLRCRDVENTRQIWTFRVLQPLRPGPRFEMGYKVEVSRSTDPRDRLRLLCVAGVALFADGHTIVLGGYLVPQPPPSQAHEPFAWLENDPVAPGSAQQEQAVGRLLEHLTRQLPDALATYLDRLRSHSSA